MKKFLLPLMFVSLNCSAQDAIDVQAKELVEHMANISPEAIERANAYHFACIHKDGCPEFPKWPREDDDKFPLPNMPFPKPKMPQMMAGTDKNNNLGSGLGGAGIGGQCSPGQNGGNGGHGIMGNGGNGGNGGNSQCGEGGNGGNGGTSVMGKGGNGGDGGNGGSSCGQGGNAGWGGSGPGKPGNKGC